MDYSSDVLRLLTTEELFNLLNLYEKDKPRNIQAYSYVLNHTDWEEKLKILSACELKKISVKCRNKFYTHRNGNLEKNGTYVSITGEEDYTISFFTLEESQKELEECLTQTQRINWSKGPTFCSIKSEYIDLLYQLIMDQQVDVEYHEYFGYYWLPKSEAIKFNYEIPDGVTLKPLMLENVPMMTGLWPHRYDQAEVLIRSLLILNGGFGLYSKTTGELLSWILRNEFGGLGLLQTVDKAQRKGYGSLLVKILSKEIASKYGRNTFNFIVDKNEKSKKLFKKLKFERVNDCYWVKITKN